MPLRAMRATCYDCEPGYTPAEVVEVLNKAVNVGLADPKLKARLADLGSVPLPGPPATFGKLIADETEKWGKVIRFAGIKLQWLTGPYPKSAAR